MAPSHLQYVLPPDLRWRLLTCKIFHLQICDGVFSPAIFCTGRFAMARSHLQYVLPPDLRWHLLTCKIFHLQIWHGTFSPAICFTASAFSPAIFCTCRFAMALSHLQHVLPPDLRWRLLTCNILYLQIWHDAFSPAMCFTARFDDAFSPAILANLWWHLLTLKIFYWQICDDISPAIFFTARFAVEPSHLHFFFRANLSHALFFWSRNAPKKSK